MMSNSLELQVRKRWRLVAGAAAIAVVFAIGILVWTTSGARTVAPSEFGSAGSDTAASQSTEVGVSFGSIPSDFDDGDPLTDLPTYISVLGQDGLSIVGYMHRDDMFGPPALPASPEDAASFIPPPLEVVDRDLNVVGLWIGNEGFITAAEAARRGLTAVPTPSTPTVVAPSLP